jgi:NAD(P)-dependent dehydrogenase (short-subunit alcohol dehydrogenase family)
VSASPARRLEGRVVAVAGAGGALGPVVVRALAQEGARVAACDRAEGPLDAVRDLAADARVADLATPEGAVAWRDAATGALGEVHALLHLVGGWRGGRRLHEAPLGDLDLLETLLFRTVVHTTRAFAADLEAAGERGRFALVSAAQAQRPSAGNAAYAAMKAAAESWTLAFAQELRDSGATANVVVINALVTPQMRAESPDKAFRTFTDAEEIAEALVFLVSDAGRKMTGQRLALHGG